MMRDIQRRVAQLVVALASSLLLGATSAFALTYEFENAFPGKVDPAGTAPWLTTTFTDNGDSVLLTVEANLGSQFLDKLYLNFNDSKDVDDLAVTVLSGKVPQADISPDQNGNKAGNDGFYDFVLNWNAGSRPTGSDVVQLELSYVVGVSFENIDPSDFDFFSEPSKNGTGPFQAAAHIQNVPESQGDSSTWIYANSRTEPPNGVPDASSTLALLGVGLMGIAGFRRKLSAKSSK